MPALARSKGCSKATYCAGFNRVHLWVWRVGFQKQNSFYLRHDAWLTQAPAEFLTNPSRQTHPPPVVQVPTHSGGVGLEHVAWQPSFPQAVNTWFVPVQVGVAAEKSPKQLAPDHWRKIVDHVNMNLRHVDGATHSLAAFLTKPAWQMQPPPATQVLTHAGGVGVVQVAWQPSLPQAENTSFTPAQVGFPAKKKIIYDNFKLKGLF